MAQATFDDVLNGNRRLARFARMREATINAIGLIMVAGFLILVLWRYMIFTIMPGHVGVLYSWMYGGTQYDRVFSEGVALKWPWDRIFIMETRAQMHDFQLDALSADGMSMQVKINVTFHLMQKAAPEVLSKIGVDYLERAIRPAAISATREEMAKYQAFRLFSADYPSLHDNIIRSIVHKIDTPGIHIEEVVILSLVLPKPVTDAIEKKLAEEQASVTLIHSLVRARLEAERKYIEATGISLYNNIVTASLSMPLLIYHGIDATQDLARSPNTKIVAIGGDRTQMPIILGSEFSTPSKPLDTGAPPVSPATPPPSIEELRRMIAPNSEQLRELRKRIGETSSERAREEKEDGLGQLQPQGGLRDRTDDSTGVRQKPPTLSDPGTK
jgi:regulator of protease activity HflC (stomatin/prohibitin superfamily)